MEPQSCVRGYHAACIAWGEPHIDLLLTIALPGLLSGGNLPSLPKSDDNLFIIHTLTEDIPRIKAHPLYTRLTHLMPVAFETIDTIIREAEKDPRNKYSVITTCHNIAVTKAAGLNCALILIAPDMLIADGGLQHLVSLVNQGRRALLCGNLRVVQETFVPAVQPYLNHDGIFSISSRSLVKAALDHLHPDVAHGFFNSPEFKNEWPDFIYWQVGREGLLQRGIFHHPILTVPDKDASIEEMTCDGADYVSRLIKTETDLHVIDDSDDFCFVDLTPRQALGRRLIPDHFSVLRIAAWMNQYAHPSHRRFMDCKIRLHHSDPSPLWLDIEAESDSHIQAVFQCLDFFRKEPIAYADARQLRVQRAYETHWNAMVSNRIRQIIHAIGDENPLVVYGAGEHTEMLFGAAKIKHRVIRLADSNPNKWGIAILGIPCINPIEIPRFAVHVLVSSKAYEQEIASDLTQMHGDKIMIHQLYNTP